MPTIPEYHPFAKAYDALLLDPNITDGERVTWLVIDLYRGQHAGAWPSEETLAEARHISRSQVSRHVSKLVKHGHLRVEVFVTMAPDGTPRRRNRYEHGNVRPASSDNPVTHRCVLPTAAERSSPDSVVRSSAQPQLTVVRSDATVVRSDATVVRSGAQEEDSLDEDTLGQDELERGERVRALSASPFGEDVVKAKRNRGYGIDAWFENGLAMEFEHGTFSRGETAGAWRVFSLFHDDYDDLDGAGHGMMNDLVAVLDAQEYKHNGKPDLCAAFMELCDIETRADYYELAKAAA